MASTRLGDFGSVPDVTASLTLVSPARAMGCGRKSHTLRILVTGLASRQDVSMRLAPRLLDCMGQLMSQQAAAFGGVRGKAAGAEDDVVAHGVGACAERFRKAAARESVWIRTLLKSKPMRDS